MPSGTPFLRALARGLTEQFGDQLQDGLILVPTRRAARALAHAFVQQARERGLSAALLPRLRPLADVNPDEPPFEPGELAGRVKPAIDPAQRRFEIAKLVAHYHARTADLPLDPAIAIRMADPLIDIMDDAALEGVSIRHHDEWKRVLAGSAEHFQHAATLYQIVERYWPKRLAEIGMMEPAARRVALLEALADTWRTNPPQYPVVVAGSTGTLRATAELMAVVANLPNGLVVLPGLQKNMPSRVWDAIDIRHPQASLKSLLRIMGVAHDTVPDWETVLDRDRAKVAAKRQRVLAEALVPVNATGDWLGRIQTLTRDEGPDIFDYALQDVSLIEARTDHEEAISIALILREAMEVKDRTAALVTPDQLLAQRVRALLARWDVDVAMSQGVPLRQTPIGVFLSGLLDLAQDPQDPVALSLVFNHPLCGLGLSIGEARQRWQVLERRHYRGQRPADIDDALLRRLMVDMMPLLDLDAQAAPDIWASALIAVCERVAETEKQPGAKRVWAGDAGRQASDILDSISNHGAALPETDAKGFSQLVVTLMQGTVVRPTRDPHPRLSILGPLEARLLEKDIVILGGLNEGTWPSGSDIGPFLSRGMREAMRLSLPERRYGLAAHDFAELAANPIVYLTRSEKDASGPTVASRWVWRLKTLLLGAMDEDRAKSLLGTGEKYLKWARALDVPSEHAPVSRPNPKPPVDKRWERQGREISITGVKTWVRDPYSLFGREVLRLKALDPLDAPLDARHFGTAMHKGIEMFLDDGNPGAASLAAHFATALSEAGYSDADIFKEKPRLAALSDALTAWFDQRKADGFDIVGTEVKAKHEIKDLNFMVKGVLDLVERSAQGYAFTDFKTGGVPSAAEIAAGFDQQLPLAAWLAQQGAMKGLPEGPPHEMGYARIKGSNDDFYYRSAVKKGETADSLAAQSIAILRELITRFDRPETGYPSQPRRQYQHDYGDYDHLARRSEWDDVPGEGE